eukprot:226448_1
MNDYLGKVTSDVFGREINRFASDSDRERSSDDEHARKTSIHALRVHRKLKRRRDGSKQTVPKIKKSSVKRRKESRHKSRHVLSRNPFAQAQVREELKNKIQRKLKHKSFMDSKKAQKGSGWERVDMK